MKHELRIHNPKTNTGIRDVPIMPQAREALLWEKRNQQASGISCKDTIGGYSNFVFLNISGHVMRAGAVNCYLKTLVRAYNKNLPVGKAPLPNITNHTLRHTFSTRLNEMNINMRAIQAILGHASVQTTMNIYTDVSTEFLADQLSLFKTR